MTELPEYDEAAALERNVSGIHEQWNELRELAGSGYKGRLTQMKNHYLRIIQTDVEAAAQHVSHALLMDRLVKAIVSRVAVVTEYSRPVAADDPFEGVGTAL